jgi:hypothetical protein
MNQSDVEKQKKYLDECVANKQFDKIVQRVSDHKQDCDRDNLYIHSYEKRIEEFKKQYLIDLKTLEDTLKGMKEVHVRVKELYEYGQAILLPKPKPVVVVAKIAEVKPAAQFRKKVLKTIEVDEDIIPPK